jgi:ABC-type sugar transport system, permease component
MTAVPAARTKHPIRWQRVLLHIVLITLAITWMFPIMWTLYAAMRPFGDVIKDGYVSWPRTLNLDNFVSAWNNAELGKYFVNTMIIAVPSVFMTLWISSMLGFLFARFSFKANILLLMMFTAGNLLPHRSSSCRSTGSICCCRCRPRSASTATSTTRTSASH